MRKKRMFDIAGGSIVVVWLLMMALLVIKINFNSTGQHTDITGQTISVDRDLQRDWMEIYLKGKKVGYSVNQITPFGNDHVIREEIFLKLNVMGQVRCVYTVTRSIVDHGFFLKSFSFTMSSGVVSYQVSGRVEGTRVFLKTGRGNERRTESIELPSRPTIGSGIAHFFKGRRLEVDRSFEFPVFDPSTVSQKDMVLKVAARETLTVGRMEYKAFRLEAEMWGQTMSFWLDESGAVLKEEGMMGLTLIRSSAANAPRGIDGTGEDDFYELAAITTRRKVEKPAKVAYLKLETEGLDGTNFDTTILNRGRQTYSGGMVEIAREVMPLQGDYVLPYVDQSGKMGLFLQPELNVESNEKEIIEQARKIGGNSEDPVSVAGRLMEWVYRNVEKRPVVTVPSALEVLKTLTGDCNEHSVLLTALLRASGIPARICVGLVYSRGRFYYHAWTESYVGRWVSMDATLNQMPVDATHVKLVEGGLDRQVEIIGLIGKLHLEVVDYRHD